MGRQGENLGAPRAMPRPAMASRRIWALPRVPAPMSCCPFGPEAKRSSYRR